jgi:hypothetical protein
MDRIKKIWGEAYPVHPNILLFFPFPSNLKYLFTSQNKCSLDTKKTGRYTRFSFCGRSSVVEHHVANVRVVSSSLIARYQISHFAGVAQW